VLTITKKMLSSSRLFVERPLPIQERRVFVAARQAVSASFQALLINRDRHPVYGVTGPARRGEDNLAASVVPVAWL
jgi:hypothetical protein